MKHEQAQVLATEPRQWGRDDFKFPPVKNRRFLVRLDIHKQEFEERGNSLVDAIQQKGHFEQRGMKAQWDFRLELQFQSKAPKPKVLLTHIPVVTRNATERAPKTVVELYPPIEGKSAQLIIEQDRTDQDASRFEDLQHEIHAWLPFVMEHFSVSKVGGFVLEYRNVIERERYPLFWEGERTLQLDRLLWLFKNNSGPGNFVTPFSVEFNTASPPPNPGNVRFHMETVQNGKQEFAMQVALAYNSLAREDKHCADGLFEELIGAHGLLFENFVRQFTPEALEAFTQ